MTPPDVTAEAALRPIGNLRLKTLIVLIASQIFGTVGATAGYTVGAVVLAALAGSTATAGVAQAVASCGTVAAAALLAKVTDAYGRRAGLSLGYLTATLGAAICVAAVVAQSFIAFAVGGVLVGVASVTNFQARFGAADLETDGEAAKGISLIVWVSTIGSVVGPNISAFGGDLGVALSISSWAGVYLIGGAGFAVSALVLFTFLRPDPLITARRLATVETEKAAAVPEEADSEEAQEAGAETRPDATARGGRFRSGAAAIRQSPAAVFALSSIATGHTIMLAIMTWTPVHMQHGSVGLAAIGAVLSGHFVGMFAFAPVFGWAADRLGRARTATFSAVLMLSALATLGLASPDATTQLGVGLFLLGLAWCGMFVVGSGLLTESIDPAARPAAQGLTDTAMWIFSAVAVGAAGWIIQVGGFGWLAGVCAVLVVPVLVLGGMLSATGEAKAADAS